MSLKTKASLFLIIASTVASTPAAFSDPLAASSEASCTNGFPIIGGPGDTVYGPGGYYRDPVPSSTKSPGGTAGKAGVAKTAAPASGGSSLNDPPKPGYGGGSVGSAPSHTVSAQVNYCYSSSSNQTKKAQPWAAKPYIPPPRVTTMLHEDDLSASHQ